MYRPEELLVLIPNVVSLSMPLVWTGFEPSPFARWETLDERGRWLASESRPRVTGVCRGCAEDQEGRTISVRYFYRHPDGWSPITADDACVWSLKAASTAGQPYVAEYGTPGRILRFRTRIPYAAYVALRFLGSQIKSEDGVPVVSGIDVEHARIACNRLALRLIET